MYNSGRSQLSCSASAGLLKEFALPLSIFASKDVRAFTILTKFMNKRPPAKKPQAKIQTVKKQIPVKKVAPDRIDELVKKHLGNIGEAENAFKSASALLEKHKTKYPELEAIYRAPIRIRSLNPDPGGYQRPKASSLYI